MIQMSKVKMLGINVMDAYTREVQEKLGKERARTWDIKRMGQE